MIIAIILNAPEQNGALDLPSPAPFLKLEHESVIERVTGTVLRGPFGVSLVATTKPHVAQVKSVLNGFAVQFVESAPETLLSAALKFAQDYRERWQKAMAAAGKRFSAPGSDEEGDEKVDWSKHKGSADVKVRSLARSFERDGIYICQADQPLLNTEVQAHLIDRFCTPGKGESPQTMRPMTQAVYAGERGYPVILSLDAAREVAEFKPGTDLQNWLFDNLARVQDVKLDDARAGLRIRSNADYQVVLKNVIS